MESINFTVYSLDEAVIETMLSVHSEKVAAELLRLYRKWDKEYDGKIYEEIMEIMNGLEAETIAEEEYYSPFVRVPDELYSLLCISTFDSMDGIDFYIKREAQEKYFRE